MNYPIVASVLVCAFIDLFEDTLRALTNNIKVFHYLIITQLLVDAHSPKPGNPITIIENIQMRCEFN